MKKTKELSMQQMLQEQENKKITRTKQKRLLFYCYCLINSTDSMISGILSVGKENKWSCSLLIAIGIIGYLILVGFQKFKSQKYINYVMFLYGYVYYINKFIFVNVGLLGLFGWGINIIALFTLLDLSYSVILHGSMIVIGGILTVKLAFVKDLSGYSHIREWYFLISLFIIAVSMWFEFQIKRIKTYRDSSLSLAVEFCEKMQEARNEAVKANQIKTEFLSNMSHDIRTPMNAIMGYAMIASVHKKETALVEDCIDKIILSGKHLQELINDILDVSRIEAGKESLHIEIVSFDELQNEIQAIILPLAQAKQIQLETQYSIHKGKVVMADKSKMRRIMVNVLGNAIKFTPQHGRIQYTVTEINNGEDGFSDYVLQVKDNGIGMSKEFQEHIFEAFAREEREQVIAESGTGLGMRIVKRYVDMMGGTLQVDSTEGVGTEIIATVRLPWCESKPICEKKEVQTDTLAGKRVLLVDDNELNREIACMMLQDAQLITDTANNGQDAIDKIQACEEGFYDFILMDMRMPVMDGLTATKYIRSLDSKYCKQVPIIALTANAFKEDEQKCIDAGMTGHIAKPFTIDALLQALR